MRSLDLFRGFQGVSLFLEVRVKGPPFGQNVLVEVVETSLLVVAHRVEILFQISGAVDFEIDVDFVVAELVGHFSIHARDRVGLGRRAEVHELVHVQVRVACEIGQEAGLLDVGAWRSPSYQRRF